MIINHTYKFVFIHVPKAAGTSVTRALSELTNYCDQEIGGSALGEAVQKYYFNRFRLRKHSSAQSVRNVMGEDTFMKYFRFSFVRNPYTRLASAYHFLKSWDGTPKKFKAKLDKYSDFESFLESDLWTSDSGNRGPDSIFQPQVKWLFSQEKNPKLLVDFVGKTESISSDLGVAFKRIGAGLPDISFKSNKSPRYSMPEKWSPNVIERIKKEYQRDFDVFGYPHQPPAGH